MSDYDDVTDCPICPQLATDRDDALRQAEATNSTLATARFVADYWRGHILELRELGNEWDRDSGYRTMLNEAADEIEQLRRWKAEAMQVLAEWEHVWEAAGRPGRLGASKAAAVKTKLERLQER